MKTCALWITGLPGSGKSSVAEALKTALPDFVILRMDNLRKVITPVPSYSDAERDIAYRSLVYLAKVLTSLGHPVIIDATGNKKKWRELARSFIPGFIEVYLKCPIEICMAREETRTDRHGAPSDIYEKGMKGWPVPGISAPYEEPDAPEILIDSNNTGVEDVVKAIIKYIARTE